MGKKLFIAVFVLVCFIVGAVIWWKRDGKDALTQNAKTLAPEVMVTSMQIKNIDEEDITIVTDAVIKNHLPATLLIDSLEYVVYMDSTEIVSGVHSNAISIKRNDSGLVSIPMEVKLHKLRNKIKRFERQERDSADYLIKAKFKMKLPIAGMRHFEMERVKRLPALRDIHIEPADLDIHKMGLKKTDLTIGMKVTNENAFPIEIKNGKFKFTVEDDIEMNGKMQKLVSIPAKGSGIIEMDINTNTSKLPKVGWKMLFKENRTHFVNKFSGDIVGKTEMMKNSHINITTTGTLADLKGVTKKAMD